VNNQEKARQVVEKISKAHSREQGGPVFLGRNCLGFILRPGNWIVFLHRRRVPQNDDNRMPARLPWCARLCFSLKFSKSFLLFLRNSVLERSCISRILWTSPRQPDIIYVEVIKAMMQNDGIDVIVTQLIELESKLQEMRYDHKNYI